MEQSIFRDRVLQQYGESDQTSTSAPHFHRTRGAHALKAAGGSHSLSRAERAVARLVVEGMTNKQIGSHLFVSPRTVESHIAHAFRKLGVSSRVQLAALLTREGSF